MKRGLYFCLILIGLTAPMAARSQVEVYGGFSSSRFHNLVSDNWLSGLTGGLLIDGRTLTQHVALSADIQGRFLFGSGKKFNGVAVGPRFSFPLKSGALTPYAEALIGFARYNNTVAGTANYGGTTDSTLQFNGGVAKRLNARWDATAEYSYMQFYALGGQYNPKTITVGAAYHFVRR